VIIAVDVGKARNHWVIRTPDGQDHRQAPFSHTQAEYRAFLAQVARWQRHWPGAQPVVAVESTGPYAEPLVHFLHHAPVQVVQVNTSHTKKVREVYDNSPGKTDRKDPHVVAD